MSLFDEVTERRGTYSTKWDKYRDTDILPMWVADMDFKSPPQITQAIVNRTEHGIYGYTDPPDELIEVFLGYLQRQFDWTVSHEELVFIPGVVPGLNVACRGFVDPGESVITVTPVYHPFLEAPKNTGHELIRVPVDQVDGSYRYPLNGLEQSIDNSCRLLLLCNPFNPVGRMLTRNELNGIANICLQNELTICSDEIHCDLCFDGRRHIPMAKINPDIEDHLVTLMSPGKTFNLSGIGGGIAIIRNPDLREKFIAASEGITGDVNLFSFEVMLTAYRDCEHWREELITCLQANRDYLKQRLDSVPGLSMNRVEATYLAWIDTRQLNLQDPTGFFESSGVGLSDGTHFGSPGYLRLNFGCPMEILEQACDRIEHAVLYNSSVVR
ncbi:MAG: PatB family C-S lyase [Gammaproteobacteria bacterium]|nr:PatB family C-S lyase [Gammaproteobacteria bacterium]